MKFSLQHALLAVLVISMILALASMHTNSKHQEYDAIIGLPQIAGATHFATSCLAINRKSVPNQVTATHLVRIQNHSNFMIEMVSFDPATEQTRREKYNVENAITAIDFKPARTDGLGSSFWVNNIIHPDGPAEHVFWIDTPENCCFWPQLKLPPAPVSDAPILVYFFSDNPLKIDKMLDITAPDHISSTPQAEIEEKCVRLGLRCVYFILREKNAE